MSNLSALRPSAGQSAASARPWSPTIAGDGSEIPENLAHPAPAQPEQAKIASQPAKVAPTAVELKKLVDDMQLKFASISSDLQFSVNMETGKTLVKLTDRTTKAVVWQFPSEEAMRIAEALDRYQKGLMLSRTA